MARLHSPISLCDDSSTTYTSGSDDAPFVNPFLNEPVRVEETVVSAQGAGEDLATRVAGSSPHRPDHKEAVDVDSDGSHHKVSFRVSPPPAPQQKVVISSETRNKEENGQTELPPPSFAKMETAYYKLSLAEQAILQLQKSLDIDRFPRSLPQRQQALQIAEARDELVKKEQALRRKDATSNSFSNIYETAALGVNQQVRQLLAECDATKAFFTRVHERKSAVAEKERLLKTKLNELEERQREVREKRQALATLERRNEQREASLIAREEKYQKNIEAHGGRERILQGKIDEVEELSQKVSSWMKILEDRDTKMAAKEQRLRRVQNDLVRRSEDLLCYRNGRAKQSTRTQPRQADSS